MRNSFLKKIYGKGFSREKFFLRTFFEYSFETKIFTRILLKMESRDFFLFHSLQNVNKWTHEWNNHSFPFTFHSLRMNSRISLHKRTLGCVHYRDAQKVWAQKSDNTRSGQCSVKPGPNRPYIFLPKPGLARLKPGLSPVFWKARDLARSGWKPD